jgi:apolipoprotein N-acyltransferase
MFYPCGRILSQTGFSVAETHLEKRLMLEGRTPYQRLGDWPAYDSILAVIGLWFWNYAGRHRMIQ